MSTIPCPNLADPPVVRSAPISAVGTQDHHPLLHAATLVAQLFLADIRHPPVMNPANLAGWLSWRRRVIGLAESCRAHKAELMRLGIPVPEQSTIRRLGALEPYVQVLARELVALSDLSEDPARWGFFVAEPIPIETAPYGWEAHPENPLAGIAQRLRLLSDSVDVLTSTTDQLRDRLDAVIRRLERVGLPVDGAARSSRVYRVDAGNVQRSAYGVPRNDVA